jgi:hypothetical protein
MPGKLKDSSMENAAEIRPDVSYNNTKEDASAFMCWYSAFIGNTKQITGINITILTWVGVAIALYLIYDSWISNHKLLTGFGITGIIALILSISSLIVSPIARKRLPKSSPPKGIVGNHHLSIDVKGFTDGTQKGDKFIGWNKVVALNEAEDYVFLLVAFSTPHVIPRRAFADEPSFRTFAKTMKDYWTTSRNGTT